MGVKIKGISTVDGRTVEVVVKGHEVESKSDIPSLVFKYNYNSTPSAPPSSSQVRTNGLTVKDATIFWVHRVDNSNIDNNFLLMQLKAGDRLYIQDIDNSDAHAIFQLTSDPVDDGNYVTFNVELDGIGEDPPSGTAILLGISG